MKKLLKVIFILTVFPFLTAFTMEEPPEFGVLKSIEFYEKKIAEQKFSVSERKTAIIKSCREELKHSTKSCHKQKKLYFPCRKDARFYTSGINYCVDKGEQRLTISKALKIIFAYERFGRDTEKGPTYKKMFYSAVNCMKAFYKSEGIELDLNIEEVSRGEQYDIIIKDASATGASPHAIPLGDMVRFYDHGELCQVVSHEFSHHFALPDRYQRKIDWLECTDQVVYEPKTLMALSKKGGFLGYSALTFHEHDIEDMLHHACPKTIDHFKKNPGILRVENYDFLSKNDTEESGNFIDSIKSMFSKFLK